MTAPHDDAAADHQSVIAELRAERDAALARRDNDYSERIAYQAATIDVLRAMTASAANPQPVFDLIVQRARELCNASGARLFEYDGEVLHYRSTDYHNTYMTPEAHEAFRRRFPRAPSRDFVPGRAVLDRTIIHVWDMDQAPWIAPVARNLGHKSTVAVPLIREQAAVGAITLNSDRLARISHGSL